MKVNLVRVSKRNRLLINYLDELSALLKEVLLDENSSKATKLALSKYKYLTFSLLQIPNRTIVPNYIIMNDEKA